MKMAATTMATTQANQGLRYQGRATGRWRYSRSVKKSYSP